jgi:hypothetical protein
VNVRLVVIQVIAAGALGVLLAVAGGFLGAGLFGGVGDSGWNDLIASVMGMLLGAALGATVGVYGAGVVLGRRGSLPGALLGGFLGLALFLLTIQPLTYFSDMLFGTAGVPTLWMLAYALGLVILCALIGFNWRTALRKASA